MFGKEPTCIHCGKTIEGNEKVLYPDALSKTSRDDGSKSLLKKRRSFHL